MHRRLSIRAEARLLTWVTALGWIANLAIAAYLDTISILGVVVAAAIHGLCFLRISRLRCPKCDKPVAWNTSKILGQLTGRYWWWTARVPKYCSKCGHPVDDDGRGAASERPA